ncbi:hypothetical protein BH11MYX4_BH11MYX4_05600 [soil metagenome]
MSNSTAAPGFPYDHLAVLGFRKLRRYVPPLSAPPSAPPRSEERGSGAATRSSVPPAAPKGT